MKSQLVLLLIVVCIIIFFTAFHNTYGTDENVRDENRRLFSMLNQNLNAIGNIDLSCQINVPVYYINLDKSTDRKTFMEDQFEKYNITDYKRIPGVLGSSLPSKKRGTYQEISYLNQDTSLNNAEIGCTLAHLRAIKQAYEDGYEMVLISEDDTVLDLVPFWKGVTSLRSLSEDAPGDWEILQLFTTAKSPSTQSKFVKFNPRKPLHGTPAYMINKKGMKKILNRITNEYGEFVIKSTELYGTITSVFRRTIGKRIESRGVADQFIYYNANTYVYNIPLFIIGDNLLPSTIHNDHETGHIKRCNEIMKSYL